MPVRPADLMGGEQWYSTVQFGNLAAQRIQLQPPRRHRFHSVLSVMFPLCSIREPEESSRESVVEKKAGIPEGLRFGARAKIGIEVLLASAPY